MNPPENDHAQERQLRQQHFRRLYKQRHPEWQSGQSLYRALVAEKVTPKTRLLDIGCGSTDFMREVYERTPHTYGIDPDARALERNTVLSHPVVGRAEALPFPDGFFDLVTLAWVIEHLEDPRKAFQEILRVLRPGGSVVFLTPNAWNYNVWLIRIIPNALHQMFTRRLYGRSAESTFPTYYRLNTPRRLDRTLRELGFHRERLLLNGDPTYLAFNRPLFVACCAGERLLDLRFLRWARVHLIGVYRKPESSVARATAEDLRA